MAIQTINYTDKVALNDDPSVADINKCKASDLNEIKSVVNNNANEIPTKTSDLNNDSGFINSDFVTVINNQSQTMTNNNTIYKYNINEVYSSFGSRLTLDTTNHEIVVGAGVSAVMVAGMLYSYTKGANSVKQIYIYKNGVQVGRSSYVVNDDYINLILPVYIFAVSQGDRISVHVRSSGSGSNSTVWANGTEGLSFITVKTI